MDFTKTGDKRLSWAVFIAFAFISLGMLLSRSTAPTQPNTQSSQNALNGQNVSAVGAVGNVIGTRAITLAGSGSLGGNLLIISDKPLIAVGGGEGQPLLHQSDTVFIQGEVHRFNRQAVEKQIGVKLSPQQFAQYEGRPFIFAHNIKSE